MADKSSSSSAVAPIADESPPAGAASATVVAKPGSTLGRLPMACLVLSGALAASTVLVAAGDITDYERKGTGSTRRLATRSWS